MVTEFRGYGNYHNHEVNIYFKTLVGGVKNILIFGCFRYLLFIVVFFSFLLPFVLFLLLLQLLLSLLLSSLLLIHTRPTSCEVINPVEG